MVISQIWSNSLLVNSANRGTDIATKLNGLSTAVQERLKNAGFFVPASNSGLSGLPFTSADAYVAGEWNVFGVSGGAPDTANKVLTVKNDAVTLNQDTTINGDLTITGALTTGTGLDSDRLTFTGIVDAAVGAQYLHFYVPDLGTAWKVVSFAAAWESKTDPASLTLTLTQMSTTWSADDATAIAAGAVIMTRTKSTFTHQGTREALDDAVTSGEFIRVTVLGTGGDVVDAEKITVTIVLAAV